MQQTDPVRHAWLDTLVASPAEAVADLMAGHAAVFPYTRGDAPDVARMLVGHLPEGDPARLALSSGILSWLNAKRAEALPADLAHLQAFVRQVTEAFEIISLLDLKTPAKDLREKYVRWRAWVELMVLSPARDALGGYLHTLAATQPLIADVVAEPDSLAPLWMRLCREAGASYPKSYLQIGLLGLRRLPQALARGESPWIAGLAHWALARRPGDREFMRAWLPIKTLCPAAPKVMRRRVFDVLSQTPFDDAGIESPGWWANDPDFPKTQDASGRRQVLQPPPLGLHESIIDDLKHGALYADVRARIQNLIKEYKRYTKATGDHYYLVRSFCNVGNVLIKNSDDAHHERADVAVSLARMALDHEPLNMNAWGLWRNALFLGGFYEASVRVGWEGVRRLPEDPLKRNDLAEILLALNQTDQAFALLTDSLEDGVYNANTFSILTRIYSNRNDMPSAHWAIQKGMAIEPDNAILRDMARQLDQGRQPALVSKSKSKLLNAERADMPGETSLEVERSGTLRSLRHRLRDGDEAALAQLEATLNEDPNFAYAQILAARHKLWKASEQAFPPVAAAFEEALAYEDRDRLQALAERMPRIEALVLLARAILGDAEAAEAVLDRLANPTSTDDKQVIEILKARIAPVLRLIEGGLSRQEAIAACATQLRTALYDANEASSAPELVAA